MIIANYQIEIQIQIKSQYCDQNQKSKSRFNGQ